MSTVPEGETLEQLAESIADMVGVYGGCKAEGGRCFQCTCRIGFVSEMKDRILQVVVRTRSEAMVRKCSS